MRRLAGVGVLLTITVLAVSPAFAAQRPDPVLRPVEHLYKNCEESPLPPTGTFIPDQETVFMNYEQGCHQTVGRHEMGPFSELGWNGYFPYSLHADRCVWKRPVKLVRSEGDTSELVLSGKVGGFQGNGVTLEAAEASLDVFPPGNYFVEAVRLVFKTPVYRVSEFRKFREKKAPIFHARVVCGPLKLDLGHPDANYYRELEEKEGL